MTRPALYLAFCLAGACGGGRPAEPSTAGGQQCPTPPPPSTDTGAPKPAQRGPRLIRIEGGEFDMGSEKGLYQERPVHRVTVETFYLDEMEVTAGQYAECVAAGVCKMQVKVLWREPIHPRSLFTKGDIARQQMENESCNLGKVGREDHPMNCVDWYQANRFCAWAFKRLPTEEEWEYAARGKEGRTYPWGNEEPSRERANICGQECGSVAKARGINGWGSRTDWSDAHVATAPVGSFPLGRTPEGIFNLSGNVSEWTASTFCDHAGEQCTEQYRVSRGDSWVAYDVMPAWRRLVMGRPSVRVSYGGFRCAANGAQPH